MNLSLYKASLKSHSKGLTMYISSVIIYVIGLLCIFPSVSKSGSMADLMNSMPEGLLKSLGMQGNLSNLNDYLNINFFNSLFLYILMAYCIMTTIKLITRPTDRTSMAYYLSSKVSRSSVIVTQFAVFLTGLLSISLSTIIVGILGKKLILSKYEFDVQAFTKINFTLLVIFMFIGVICFLIATVANTESLALSVSSSIVIGSYAIDIIKKLSKDLECLKYIDIFALYDPEKITQNFSDAFKISIILILVSIVLVVCSIRIFKRKDLIL